MGGTQTIIEGQILTGPLFNEPMRVETVSDQGPAWLNWHEVVKVAHYTLSVNAVVQPMEVNEVPKPYGDDLQ